MFKQIMRDKKGQLDLEIAMSPTFLIFAGIGYAAFAMMLVVLKKTGGSEVMPLWVKIVTVFTIPLIAYVWAVMYSD